MKYNNFRISLLGLVVLFLSGCRQGDAVTREVQSCYAQKHIAFNPELELCLILPEVGCDGCIAGGVYFLLNNKEKFSSNQNKNMVVFTAVQSRKMLYRSLDVTSLDGYNCILDQQNDYLVKGNNEIYPLVLHLEEGRIVKAEYQSPTSRDVLGGLNLK